jgi:hypothetical protein
MQAQTMKQGAPPGERATQLATKSYDDLMIGMMVGTKILDRFFSIIAMN